jgi:hypothetical protein
MTLDFLIIANDPSRETGRANKNRPSRNTGNIEYKTNRVKTMKTHKKPKALTR